MDGRSKHRLRTLLRHFVRTPLVGDDGSDGAALLTAPCIGESAHQSRRASRASSKFARLPVKVVFEDVTAKHERYGGSGNFVILEGDWLKPRQPSKTILIFMHPSGIMNLLPMPAALAYAGFHVLIMACRYPNNDSCLIMEKVVMDLGAVVNHAKTKLQYDKVVLCGWSGGGALCALYQAQAEKPTITHTPAGDEVNLLEAGLIPADGLMLLAAHSSRARIFTEWLDPAVLDEQNPSQRDASLDIFHPQGPKPPFSAAFVANYRAAQVARNHKITAWAKERLRLLEESKDAQDWRMQQRDEAFIVHCTQADLARIDLAVDSNGREVSSLKALAEENHSPVGLARFTTLRSWLSQWSLEESQADTLKCLPATSVPTFVLDNGADHLVLPSHTHSMYQAIPHGRKVMHREEKATHYYFGQQAVLSNVVQMIREWMEKEGLLGSSEKEEVQGLEKGADSEK